MGEIMHSRRFIGLSLGTGASLGAGQRIIASPIGGLEEKSATLGAEVSLVSPTETARRHSRRSESPNAAGSAGAPLSASSQYATLAFLGLCFSAHSAFAANPGRIQWATNSMIVAQSNAVVRLEVQRVDGTSG